jgi:hypothetical protein
LKKQESRDSVVSSPAQEESAKAMSTALRKMVSGRPQIPRRRAELTVAAVGGNLQISKIQQRYQSSTIRKPKGYTIWFSQ